IFRRYQQINYRPPSLSLHGNSPRYTPWAAHLPPLCASILMTDINSCTKVLLGICLERADLGATPPIFGFAQYVSTLALLVVVFNVSDFRYRFRLLLTRLPVRNIAFGVGASIGVLILLIDIWFNNAWLIPARLNFHNNLRAVLAVVFI